MLHPPQGVVACLHSKRGERPAPPLLFTRAAFAVFCGLKVLPQGSGVGGVCWRFDHCHRLNSQGLASRDSGERIFRGAKVTVGCRGMPLSRGL